MALKRITPEHVVVDFINENVSRLEQVILRNLSFIGEKCVRWIRDRSQQESWYDQSGNLRSSIGYVIVKDGRIISEGGFDQVKSGTIGVSEGKRFAKEIAASFPQGFALIVVAGMKYAAYVEAMDNKDVLASSELIARKLVDELIRKFKL